MLLKVLKRKIEKDGSNKGNMELYEKEFKTIDEFHKYFPINFRFLKYHGLNIAENHLGEFGYITNQQIGLLFTSEIATELVGIQKMVPPTGQIFELVIKENTNE